MKRMFKLGLPILALLIGASLSAFTNAGNSGNRHKALMYWYTYNPSTNQIVSEIGHVDEQGVQDATGCDNTTAPVCAKGYSTQQTGLPKTAPSGATNFLSQQP
jgi:hypothetical protein